MNNTNTLSDILLLSGSELRVYEMGRQIQQIDNQDFQKVETNDLPYPAPIQQQARFALCFWQKQQANTPYIWFLQFPVDEQGFIQLGARDQFIQLVIEALGQQLDQQPNQQQQQALANNQYIFKPTEEKLAYFNALYKKHCALPPSKHYPSVRDYLQGSAWDKWPQLALQGLADIVARLDRDDNSKLLAKAFPHLPMEVANKTLELLEHASIDQQLSHVIAQQHTLILTRDENLASLYLRALAGCTVPSIVNKALNAQLGAAHSIHSFIAIAGRLWRVLEQPHQLRIFLEALATQQDDQLFQQIFADLVFIPSLRSFVLAQLRDPNNSTNLQAAIQQLVRSYQPTTSH
ncbi:DUF3549 family protein [Agarivorans sp. QJM3NY_29]|uniref:DUF3549 family protein n=1 Tax=unclassified Agarivorans TaxID=2636026 RepID=UPI003D7EB3C1